VKIAPILMTWGRPKTTDTADQDRTRRNKNGRFILETILKFSSKSKVRLGFSRIG
jgi:hypothetical protein